MSKLNDIFWNLSKKPRPKQTASVDDLFNVWNSSSTNAKKSHLSINSNLKDDDENIIWFVNDLFLNSIQNVLQVYHIEPNEKNIRTRLRIGCRI